MRLKLLAGGGLVAALLVASAAPALAHITTDPPSAPKGGELIVRFSVPNEVINANVVKVDVAFPTDHPLLGVVVEPMAGWTSAVTEIKLNPPVQTDDGPVAQAVSEIVWNATGGGAAPGQFQDFPVLVQRLPTDTDQVVFKAIQTYSDGTVVRWIDPVVAGQPAPDHPTPLLKLTAAADGALGGTGSPTATTLDQSKLAPKSLVSAANTRAAIGIVVGVLGLIVALAAMFRRGGGRTARSGAATPE